MLGIDGQQGDQPHHTPCAAGGHAATSRGMYVGVQRWQPPAAHRGPPHSKSQVRHDRTPGPALQPSPAPATPATQPNAPQDRNINDKFFFYRNIKHDRKIKGGGAAQHSAAQRAPRASMRASYRSHMDCSSPRRRPAFTATKLLGRQPSSVPAAAGGAGWRVSAQCFRIAAASPAQVPPGSPPAPPSEGQVARNTHE